jgi:hypothetical protein
MILYHTIKYYSAIIKEEILSRGYSTYVACTKQWLTPVILATWEVRTGGLWFKASPDK